MSRVLLATSAVFCLACGGKKDKDADKAPPVASRPVPPPPQPPQPPPPAKPAEPAKPALPEQPSTAPGPTERDRWQASCVCS